VSLTPFQELVQRRRSIRRFRPDPVDRADIIACLEAARLAPSASNVQPWRFLVVDDPELKARLAKAAFSGIFRMSNFVANAPVIILLLAKKDVVANRLGRAVQGVSYYLIDLGIAGQHLALQAEELGLGTCWVGWFNIRKTRKVLKIPRKYKIVAMMPFGHILKRPSRPLLRKPLEEVAWWNRVED